MASANFKKCKGSDASAIIRHCDSAERLKHEHSNKEIDLSRTKDNLTWFRELSYRDTMKRLKDRIAYLDATTNTNHRSDRVESYAIEIPIPADRSYGDNYKPIANDIMSIMERRFGKDNIVNAYLHVDEIHDYIDSVTHEKRTSMAHIHAIVVPEIDGRLCGKQFSSKKAMRELNRELDEMFLNRYGVKFLKNDKQLECGRSVEDLKVASYQQLEKQVTQLREELDLMQREYQAGVEQMESIRQEIDDLQNRMKHVSERFKTAENPIKINGREVCPIPYMEKQTEAFKQAIQKYLDVENSYSLEKKILYPEQYRADKEKAFEAFQEVQKRILEELEL